jgi:hypothetical protein
MNEKIRPGIYRHYKGKEYEILGVGHHSETLDPLVIYRALYDTKEFGNNSLWARPLDLFLEEVDLNGQKVPRFEYLGDKS